MWKLLLLSLLSLLPAGPFAVELPGYLERHMNLSASPCADFYEFACGGWRQVHEGRAFSNQLEQLDHVYHGQLAKLLEQPQTPQEPRFQQLLRYSYAACRSLHGNYDTAQFVRWLRDWGRQAEQQEEQDEVQLQELEEEKEQQDEHASDRLLQLLLKLGLPSVEWPTDEQVAADAVNWLLKQQQPWPYLEADAVEQSEADASNFQPLSGAQFRQLYRELSPWGVAEEQLWQQVQQLEQQLWQLTKVEDVHPQEEQRQAEQEIQELEEDEEQGELPELLEHEQLHKWLQLEAEHQEQLSEEQCEQCEQQLPAEYAEYPPLMWLLPVPLPVPHWQRYVRRLPALLLRLPRPLLVRYLLLRLLHKLQPLAAPTFGRHDCAAQTRQMLPHAADWLLEQQQTPEQRQLRQHQLQRLLDQLRWQFRRLLFANRNRFQPAMVLYLLEKLTLMRLRVGLLPTGEQRQGAASLSLSKQRDAQQAEQQLLDAHYAQLQLSASDYYGNLLATQRQHEAWARQYSVGDLRDRRGLVMVRMGYGIFGSPFFISEANLLVLPLSLLAPPIYRSHQADVYALSSLGFLIAHEMSHAFTPSDVVYNGRGKRLQMQQMVELFASLRFEKQRLCMATRYDHLADEKFCDLNGIAVAFDAYLATPAARQQRQQRQQRHSQQLQQHFFLNFAQFFCENEQQLSHEIDVHGGNRQRVNEAVASLDAFGSAFGCPRAARPRACQLY
ncbi:hypothetical protein KR222_001191 [Zaprionus bogoriensis]|nr:hypothetical protein KR222_001191 [Zaprionus bogoriensis]